MNGETEEQITGDNRQILTDTIVREILNNSDSISYCARQILISVMDAGIYPRDLERAIAWWRSENPPE